MAVVAPESSRALIQESADKVSIIIPVRRNWFIFLFLSVWLCGWAVGEIAVLGGLLFGAGHFFAHAKSGAEALPASAFMLVWITFWTIGGAFAILTWLYQLKGREIVVRDGRYLAHTRDFVVFKRSQEYLNEHIQNLRSSPASFSPFNMNWGNAMQFWGMGGGCLAFDYGAKTIRIRTGLEEAEATPLARLLEKYGR